MPSPPRPRPFQPPPEQDKLLDPTPQHMSDAPTSETGDAGSILFSEQAQIHDQEQDVAGPSSRRFQRERGKEGAEEGEQDADMETDDMGSNFFYVEEDTAPSGVAAVEPEAPLGDDDHKMDEDAPQNDDNPELNFWMDCIRDPDAPTAEEGGQEDVNDTPRARPPQPTPPPKQATTTQAADPSDQMTRVLEAKEEEDEMFLTDNGDEMEEDMDDEDEDEEEDYDEPESYHSGDSDQYEMEHRPWLERTAVKKDISALYGISGLWNDTLETYRYRVVDRLGEGTFSSVYLANDELHNVHDNSYWAPDEPPVDPDRIYEPSTTKVALKKILVTSSPSRIENELSILENLRGCRNVSPLVTAFRDEDQVVIVLPFHQADDFRYFYRLMDPPKIKQYMTCLLRGLKDIHSRGIIHRDVKPANFLFDYESGKGVLVDFGLAERYVPPRRATCQHEPATRAALHGLRTKTTDTVAVEQAVYDARKRAKSGDGRIGFRQEDSRPAIKTNRAGTRGFRAPEVLLKCPDQTVAIDVWSAGVMLLSILAHKFPVFNSTDDIESLMEIAAVFGRATMERCALLHNRTIMTNVPTVDNPPDSLPALILRLNPHLYTPHQPHPTPEEAIEHITAIDAALDLCARLLRLDSTTRTTAAVALRHRFLGDPEDDGPDELLDPTEGKCGHLHTVTDDGTHQARFGDMMEDMRFGQGIPTSRTKLCPEHEHWQQRSGVNPLGAAYGATLDEDYYQHAGFHTLTEHAAWNDQGARDKVNRAIR